VGAVRLGRNVLHWCDICNLPILENEVCSVCSGKTHEVKLTPPADSRPAFEGDLSRIRKLAERQFGTGCGELLLPKDRIAILNRSPSLDRMDEIISDGFVLGAAIYDPPEGERLIIRTTAAERILPGMRSGRVTADDGALPSISKGSNLMGPGVISSDSDIEIGDEVVVLNGEDKVVATGIARKSSGEMALGKRGVAVKIRWRVDGCSSKSLNPRSNDWDSVIHANSECIERKVETAKKFILRLPDRYGKPVAVSFSGGKDSLVTLSLALESGLRPDIMFVDTGLELDETIEEVDRIADEMKLNLITEKAGEAFWEGIEIFGPPGKDFRWCCKTCKLGPTTKMIRNHFPEGVISLIGQRSYESEQRMRKGAVWKNPWVPGQIGASPIQKWNAMHVWLYILSRGLRYNPWYDRGLERIGCFMCPSSDIAELDLVKSYYSKYGKWEEYLRSYALERNLPNDWLRLAIWRWKRIPPAMRRKIDELGISIPRAIKGKDGSPLSLSMTEGFRPCTSGGLSAEGVFSMTLDMNRVANLLNILGPVEYLEDENITRVAESVVFGEGAVSIKADTIDGIREFSKKLEDIARRAMLCIGCGICSGRCPQDAINVDGQASIDTDRCIHCEKCLGPCPVSRFEGRIEI